MSDSTDNTNDLDSYGVWVKRPPQDSSEEADTLPDFSDFDIPEENTSQEGIDIPEVGDISDMSFDDSSSSDEELSLDDFMDGDFVDPNPGAATMPELEVASDSDEISLDDFFDDDTFGTGGGEKEDDVPNDDPLNIDISFNENSENEVPTEEIKEEDELSIDDLDSSESSSNSYDDMFSTENETVAESTIVDNSEEISLNEFKNSEDVDLSDFGIDSNAEETPVTSNVSESTKSSVVDYDLAITDDDTVSEVPTINEVHTTNHEKTTENTNGTVVDNSLLEKIVADLTSLKNEISSLKNDFEELKSKEQIIPQEEVPVQKSESTFFENSEDDDTIALDNDELNNIVNTSDISEEIDNDSGENEDFSVSEETISEETVSESVDEPIEEIIDEVQENELDNNFTTDTPFGSFDETDVDIPSESEETASESGLSMDFEDESLEEPNLEETEDSIAEEISIPKVDDVASDEINDDDVFIESNSTDFMDSVSTASDNATFIDNSETIADEILPEEAAEEIKEETEVAQEDNGYMDDLLTDDPSVKEGLSEENVSYLTEETIESNNFEDEPEVIDEPVVEEEFESSVEEPVLEEEEISEENYTTEPEQNEGDLPSSIKNDVKSVLLCMDQLLESLPEDKIMEFAKSEQFTTYKKLFKELGLSE